MKTLRRTSLLLLPLALAVLAGCQDRELPTALSPGGGPSLSTAVTCGDVYGPYGLIASIDAANANPGPDVIDLAPACTYTLRSVNNVVPIQLGYGEGANGLPVISGELTINGNGARIERSAEEGTPDFRIFSIADQATVNIFGLTIANGRLDPIFIEEDELWYDFDGGGIRNRGTLTLTNSTVSGNTASARGGGIYNNYPAYRPTVTLENTTVSGNRAARGGGIHNDGGPLTLTNSTVSDNTAGSAGGISASAGGPVTVTQSTVSGNSATSLHGTGGGIRKTGDGLLTVTHSTLSGNSAASGGGIMFNSGGAVTVTVTQSTVSGNSATDRGGGILQEGSGRLTVTHSTLSGNSAATGGGIWRSISGHSLFGQISLRNTIVANSPSGGDCSGSITDLGYNLSSDGSCGFTASSLSNTDPRLGPLQNNGGPTLTHALLTDGPPSPAIDAGDPDFDDPDLPSDQRGEGFARVSGVHIDIGAFEVQQTPPPPGYRFEGFSAPVSNPDTLNVAKAGQTIPLKWRLLQGGQPVDLSAVSVTVVNYDCGLSTTTDADMEYTAGKSGLQNLGDGYYQYNWATQKGYANSCKRLTLTLDGIALDAAPQALFTFTK